MTEKPFEAAELHSAAAAGTQAASLHNSQPWQFRLRAGTIEVLADPRDHAAAADQIGWAVRIACGAAVFNARLALLANNTPAEVQLRPDPGDPMVMARLRPGRLQPPTYIESDLFAAVGRRRNSREPFRPDPVPANLRKRLIDAAQAEGAWLELLIGMTALSGFAQIAQSADRVMRRDPAYQTWLSASIRTEATRAGEPEPEPLIAILGSIGATAADQINAGQALQRVLLTATDSGLATSMISQPIEVRGAREQLSRSLGGRIGTPQMALRVGYGQPGRTTPRHDLVQTITLPAVARTFGPAQTGIDPRS